MNKKLRERIPSLKRSGLAAWVSPHDPYYEKLTDMGVGQCGMLTMSLYIRGLVRLVTLVNRAITIGEQGANYSIQKYPTITMAA